MATVIGKKKVDFTEGKILIKMLRFVLPIIATNLLQMFYNAADMMVVSLSHESNAVGAIGTTSSFVHLLVHLFIGFSVGTNVVVARHIGEKNEKKVNLAVHTSLIMSVLFGILGMTAGIILATPIMQLMGNKDSLLTLAVTYLDIYFIGIPFLSLTNYLVAIFRAKGDAKTPLVVLSIAGVFNVVMNLFFVLVVGLSVEGVALATTLANAVSAVILFWKLKKDNDSTQFSWKDLRIDKKSFFDIIKIGLPAGIQSALFSLSNMIIQSSIIKVNNNLCPPNSEYQPVINGSSAAGNLEGFVYTAMNGVYQGSITATSQNIGAQKPKRIYQIMHICFLATSVIGLVMGGLLFLFREPLLGLYGVIPSDTLAIQTATIRIEYICLPYFICGIQECCTGILRGMGKSTTAMFISLIGACLFRLVWMWTVFPAFETLESIFISYPISWILLAMVGFTAIQILLSRIIKKQTV